ncbi:MAG TPA: response regulator [Vicinamibacterales bacterium]|nr:response regulator [Vicinamibacterales bacterium]
MPADPSPRSVLLVEDNPADADLVREMMEESEGDRYRFRIVHSTRMSDALGILVSEEIDVILLDLGLPDSSEAETLVTIRASAGRAPIVVLTGRDDDALAMQCIDLGAQDYLSKSEIRPASLRRSIGYAITRSHEAEIRDLRDALEHYRDLSTTATQTATPAACGALRDRAPKAFGDLAEEYTRLLRRHFDGLVVRVAKPRDTMTRIATLLGDQGAGPRDLVDVHVAALSRSVEGSNTLKTRTLALEGRLLALEMMGLLVDYYRVRNTAPRR